MSKTCFDQHQSYEPENRCWAKVTFWITSKQVNTAAEEEFFKKNPHQQRPTQPATLGWAEGERVKPVSEKKNDFATAAILQGCGGRYGTLKDLSSGPSRYISSTSRLSRNTSRPPLSTPRNTTALCLTLFLLGPPASRRAWRSFRHR